MSDLVLIDLSSIFWSAWHATADKELNAAFEITLSTIQRHAGQHQRCAVCCDSPPYWRKEVAPSYKAQRDRPEPNALDQLRRVKARLEADGFLLWESLGFEADDVIASACAIASSDMHALSVTIVSSDKDLTQLISPTVVQVKPDGKDVFDERAILEKYGVIPSKMRDLLALWGDSSDNVPGVPGIGPKTAAKLLHDFGDIDTLLTRLAFLPPGKTSEALAANVEQLKISRQLVTLRRDVELNFEDIYAERSPQRITEETDMQEIDDEPESERPSEPQVELPSPKAVALVVTDHSSNGNGIARFEHGLQPGTLGAAYKLAKGLYESRLYSRFPNAEAIWAIIIRGRELGIGALTALDNFHIVENKPVAGAHFLIARAKAHPDCEYLQFVGGDATYAEAETKNKRAPKPTRLRYTMEQAKRAGLVRNGSNWEKRPEDMLNKTVMVKLARIEYPSATAGLYCEEEMG